MSSDPTGKRSLFTSRPSQDQHADGKEALFSRADEAPGPVTIECSQCEATTTVGALDAARRIMGLSVWIPGRTYSRRLRCPSCRQRTWVRLSVG